MCGIAGAFSLDGEAVPPGLLVRMSGAIAHRGPDDAGYVLINRALGQSAVCAGPASRPEIAGALPLLPNEPGPLAADVALGHRRFSIIDLTSSAHQPFFTHDNSCCLVFNGEIYNYLELREGLRSAGAVFRTNSDTEVLAEAYSAWGPDCFRRFNGFWALALYDFRNKRLILSRDRAGKKPLYWTRVESRVYFASEIKALLVVPEIHARRKVNAETVYPYLAFGFRGLGETTFFEGIQQIPPGSWAVVNESFPGNARRFWELPPRRLSEKELPAEEAARELRARLEDAVRLRLRSDVPIGVELSGGMDSSSILVLAARHYPGRVPAYTVRWAAEKWNEEPFARAVAERCGADYHPFDPPLVGFWRHILAFTRLEEEPYNSPNLQTNQGIWALMRGAGAKVSLMGTGGDEIFAGYPPHYEAAQIENLAHLRLGAYLRNAFGWTSAPAGARAFGGPLLKLFKRAVKKGLPFLDRKSLHASFIRGVSGSSPDLFPLTLDAAIRCDFSETLLPYWLMTVDKGSMGLPIETRAPFLDHRVVEWGYSLPVGYLVRDGWHKWILRKSMEGVLPPEVLWRRRKMGFPFSYEEFFAKSRPIIDLILRRADNPYLDFSQQDRFHSRWPVLSFILWYEMFINENLSLFRDIEALSVEEPGLGDSGYVPEFLAGGVQ